MDTKSEQQFANTEVLISNLLIWLVWTVAEANHPDKYRILNCLGQARERWESETGFIYTGARSLHTLTAQELFQKAYEALRDETDVEIAEECLGFVAEAKALWEYDHGSFDE